MKNYLLFGGADYYPEGGWHDYIGRFDTLDEANAEGHRIMKDRHIDLHWFHVVNIQNGQVFK